MSSKIRFDLFLALSSDVLGKLLGYIILATLARVLSQAAMGELFFAMAFASVLAMVTEFGTNRYLLRRVAQAEGDATMVLSEVLTVRLPAVLGAFVVLSISTMVIDDVRTSVLLLTGLFVFIGDIYYSFGALFLGLRRVGYRFVTGLFDPLLLVPLVLVAVALGWDLVPILWCYVASKAVSVLLTALITRWKFGRIKLVTEGAALRQVARGSFDFFLLAFLGLVYLKVDTLMILFFRSVEEVAQYEAGYKFFEISRFAVRSAGMVFFPLCAQLVAASRWDELAKVSRRLVLAAGLGGTILAAGVIITAPFLVPFVWGDAYVSSIPILRLLFLGTPFLYVSYVGTFISQALHRERAVVSMMAVAVVLNVLMNIMAIPRWGAQGAAGTTVVGEIALSVALLFFVLRQTGQSRDRKSRD